MPLPEVGDLINQVQRNEITEANKPLVCKAVQDYYKVLHAVGAVKAVKEKAGENVEESKENKTVEDKPKKTKKTKKEE